MVKQNYKNVSAIKMVASRVAALIAALMLACSLAGCASGADNSSSNASSSSAVSSSSSSASDSSSAADSSSSSDVVEGRSILTTDGQIAKITIEAPDVEGFTAFIGDVAISNDSTALSTLQDSGDIVVEDSSYGPFVTSINGLANGEYGTQSGWTYTVNGEYATVSAGDYKVKAGDNIVWTYMV